jgi:hypothetical protein
MDQGAHHCAAATDVFSAYFAAQLDARDFGTLLVSVGASGINAKNATLLPSCKAASPLLLPSPSIPPAPHAHLSEPGGKILSRS